VMQRRQLWLHALHFQDRARYPDTASMPHRPPKRCVCWHNHESNGIVCHRRRRPPRIVSGLEILLAPMEDHSTLHPSGLAVSGLPSVHPSAPLGRTLVSLRLPPAGGLFHGEHLLQCLQDIIGRRSQQSCRHALADQLDPHILGTSLELPCYDNGFLLANVQGRPWIFGCRGGSSGRYPYDIECVR